MNCILANISEYLLLIKERHRFCYLMLNIDRFGNGYGKSNPRMHLLSMSKQNVHISFNEIIKISKVGIGMTRTL